MLVSDNNFHFSAGGRAENEGAASDEEAANNDNASVISNASSGYSVTKDEAAEEPTTGTTEELSATDVLEEKLREHMDLAAGQKSTQSRATALTSICLAFVKKLMPEFVGDRYSKSVVAFVARRGTKRRPSPAGA